MQAVLFALITWWAGTGLVLYLDRRPTRSFGWSLGVGALLATGALYGVIRSSSDPSAAGAYLGFVCAVVIWGWHELAFLTGHLSGPRRRACRPGSTGWSRFVQALAAILYHELALLVTVLALWALCRDAPNPIGAWTFAGLWVLRLSAKLNLFLGVPNVGAEFLPDGLRYLESHFRRGPMNPLLPVSVIGCSGGAAWLFLQAGAPAAAPFEVAGYALLGTFAMLAVLEHLFMVLPIPSILLWKWATGPQAQPSAAAVEPPPARTPPA